MRILHLTTEYPPVIYGGLGTAVGGWVTASARSGITAGVLLVEGSLLAEGATTGYGATLAYREPAARAPHTDSHGVTFFQASWADAVPVALGVMRRWRPNVIHLHTAMLWYVADAIQRRTRAPIVYHVHSVDRAEYEIGQEPSQWLAHSHAQEAAIAAADRLIAISRSERDLLTHYYPQCRDRITTVGNGIDYETDSSQPPRPSHRRRPGVGTVVLYSGRLVERKGIRDLTATIPRVLRAAPNTQFVLAGGPPGVSGADLAHEWLPPSLEDAILSHIHFTGWLSARDLTGWYRAADILVVPSRYEPFGMVVLEGMLHALPIIASDTGGPREILQHRSTGLLFPPQDVDQLTAYLIELVENPNLRANLGQAAAREVRRAWSWSRMVATMRDVYTQLAAPDAATQLAS
jgi:glycosyltransferase involved in cell wall biosynthesis